jgi:hypothetical protein
MAFVLALGGLALAGGLAMATGLFDDKPKDFRNAALNGNLSKLRSMLAEHADFLNKADDDGDHAMLCAAMKGHWECVRWLVQQGEVVKHANKKGWTALMYAVHYGSVEMVKFLLDNGADVNGTNKDGYTALMLAAEKGFQPIVELLSKAASVELNKGAKTALWLAVSAGKDPTALYLIGAGTDVNKADAEQGRTPLYLAADVGKSKMPLIEALVKKGANVNQATTKGGKTPVHVAAEKGFLDVVTYLVVDGKADVNTTTTDPLSPSPLYAAMLKKDMPVVSFLLEHGADTKVVNKEQKSLLYVYVDGQGADADTAMVDTLVAKGCSVNAAAVNGKTCLYLAVAKNVLPLAEHLLKKGADPNVADAELGQTRTLRMNPACSTSVSLVPSS